MIAYLEGKIYEKNPAYIILDCGGIGYMINISLYTFSNIPDSGTVKIFTHLAIREDAHVLYGFATEGEKELFRNLITVSGVGPNTARVILSSYAPGEVKKAILDNDSGLLQSVKGIGAKTAQRIVVDLRDKLKRDEHIKDGVLNVSDNTTRKEALSALVMLGFAKNSIEKVLDKITVSDEGKSLSAEAIVKEALKRL